MDLTNLSEYEGKQLEWAKHINSKIALLETITQSNLDINDRILNMFQKLEDTVDILDRRIDFIATKLQKRELKESEPIVRPKRNNVNID